MIGNYFACSTHALAVNIIGKRELSTSTSTAAANSVAACQWSKILHVLHQWRSVWLLQLCHLIQPNKYPHSSETLYWWCGQFTLWTPPCNHTVPDVWLQGQALWDNLARVEHWLYFNNMGGYTVGVASTFNGFEIPVRFHCVTKSYG